MRHAAPSLRTTTILTFLVASAGSARPGGHGDGRDLVDLGVRQGLLLHLER